MQHDCMNITITKHDMTLKIEVSCFRMLVYGPTCYQCLIVTYEPTRAKQDE
jgi:hypothetical protein